MGWSASTDNVGVTGYDVYRNGTKIATTGLSATSYTYTALTCNTTYTVGLVAFDAAGNRSNLAGADPGRWGPAPVPRRRRPGTPPRLRHPRA